MAEQFTPTLTPEATGGVGAVEEVGAQLNRASLWDSAFGLLGTAAKTAAVLTEEDKLRAKAEQKRNDELESYRGYTDGVAALNDLEGTSALDTFNSLDGRFSEVESGESSNSSAYNKGFLNTIKSRYESSSRESKEISNTQSLATSTKAHIVQGNVSVKGIKEYINLTKNVTGLDGGKIRDMYIASMSATFGEQLNSIEDKDTLEAFKTDWRVLQKDLNSDASLFGNRSKGVAGEVIARAKANIKNAISSAETRINKGLDAVLAQDLLTFDSLPSEHASTLINRHGKGTKEYLNGNAQYIAAYDDFTLTTELLSKGDGVTGYDWIALGNTKNGTKQAKQLVHNAQSKALEEGDYNSLVHSIANNPQHSTPIGTEITHKMNQFETEAEGAIIFGLYGDMLDTQDGAAALSVAQGKDYKKDRLAYELYTSGAIPSVTNARENANIIMNNKGLSPATMTKSEKAYMAKKSKEYGPEQSEFMFLAQNIVALGTIKPDKATDMVDKLYSDRRVTIGDHTINNMPPNLKQGSPELFSKAVDMQLKAHLNLEDSEYDSNNYIIKASDDVKGEALVFRKDNGVYETTVNLEDAAKDSTDPKALAASQKERQTYIDVKNTLNDFGNDFADALDKYIADPTGTSLSALQGIGDFSISALQDIGSFAIAEEGSASQIGIRKAIESTREKRVAEGKKLKDLFPDRAEGDVGPKELFSAIGSVITAGKEVASAIINKFTPAELRDEPVKNPHELEIIQDINKTKVDEAIKMRKVLNALDAKVNTALNASGVEEQATYNVTSKEDFVEQVTPVAESVASKIGPNISPEWLVNMWRLETGNGESEITKNTFNLGNIKGEGFDAGKVPEQTETGEVIQQQASFRKYKNFQESGEDFADLLSKERYAEVREARTEEEFFTALQNAGYATDINYAEKLINF